MSSSPILACTDVHVAYGKTEAVHGVSLAVPEGGLVTVIGANGAGKTTLLHALMGILPARGQISFAGRAVEGESLETRVASGLCLVPENRELFSDLTVEDNLRLGGIRRTATERAETLDAVYDRFGRLRERRRQLAGTLSGGERQMLAMGRALMTRPRVLMLDEPSLGLAPLIVAEVFAILGGLKRTGVSILLVEQNARAALALADHAYVMELGRVTVSGPAAELAQDSRLVESYLGLGAIDY